MNYLLIIPIILIVFSNLYIFKFQGSLEGNDERGQLIRLQTTSFMYNVLFIGLIFVIILSSLNFIHPDWAFNLIFGLILFNSVFGAIYLYVKKK